jgi:2,3-bisphosphoglycerate-dependent phosphoglycerate mutase
MFALMLGFVAPTPRRSAVDGRTSTPIMQTPLSPKRDTGSADSIVRVLQAQTQSLQFEASLRFEATRRMLESLANAKPPKTKVGQLILLRHGQSEWNKENLFTGWANVDLTEQGREEALGAAEMLLDEPGLEVDVCYTSVLSRSIETGQICLDAMAKDGRRRPKVMRRWRLNERHYGALTGLNKREALETLDASSLRRWRATFDGRPPPMEPQHPHYSRTPERYARLLHGTAQCDRHSGTATSETREEEDDDVEPLLSLCDVPLTESLSDTRARVDPLWLNELRPSLLEGKTVLVVGHANCLRALVSCIQPGLHDEHLPSLGVPNALPLVYTFAPNGDLVTELPGRCYIKPLDAHYLGDACPLFNELEGAGDLPEEADCNGDGVVDFNEYMSWWAKQLEPSRSRGHGGGGARAGRIRG